MMRSIPAFLPLAPSLCAPSKISWCYSTTSLILRTQGSPLTPPFSQKPLDGDWMGNSQARKHHWSCSWFMPFPQTWKSTQGVRTPPGGRDIRKYCCKTHCSRPQSQKGSMADIAGNCDACHVARGNMGIVDTISSAEMVPPVSTSNRGLHKASS